MGCAGLTWRRRGGLDLRGLIFLFVLGSMVRQMHQCVKRRVQHQLQRLLTFSVRDGCHLLEGEQAHAVFNDKGNYGIDLLRNACKVRHVIVRPDTYGRCMVELLNLSLSGASRTCRWVESTI